jgi:TolB-like protein/Flp pilus assembly protein TadD
MVAAGTKLGRYQILGMLGAGGMGEVFRARDVRLERDVAVKVLPAQFAADADRLARFEREAKAVAALAHPNILVLHDFGSHEGVCYTVTELLEGETLRRQVSVGPVPWRKAVEIGAAIADGLAAAHAKGIIHRDLKPDNLFLTADGRVKILDFGLARLESTVAPDKDTGPYVPPQTGSGVVMGTAGYMSPEQLRGKQADARSDIFSLGCVLYEMVSGRRAFGGSSASEMHAAILRDDPAPLTAPGHEVPPPLERLIRRCLEKKPEQRIQSARDLAFDLRALLTASDPLQPAGAPRGRRGRPALWAGVLLGLVFAALLGAGLYALFSHRAQTQGTDPGAPLPQAIEAVAVLPLEGTGKDPDAEVLGDGISEIIIVSLYPLRNLKVRPFSAVVRYKGQNPDPKAVGEELKVQAVLTGRVVRQGNHLAVNVQLVDVRDNSLLWGDHYSGQFADVFAIQEDIARQISSKVCGRLSGEEERRLAKRQTENTEAYQFYFRGRHYLNNSSSEEETNRAIASFRKALEKDPNYPLAHVGLAEAYYWLSNLYKAPIEVLPQAEEAARKALQLDDQLGEAHAMLGLFLAVYHWDWPAAEAEFRRAVELSPGSGTVHLSYGLCLNMAGRHADAVAAIRRARELDPSSPLLAAYSCFALYQAGEVDRALSELKTLHKLNPKNYLILAYLGLCYEHKHEYDQAIATFLKAIALDENPEAKAQLGHVYAVAGHRDDALKSLAELKEIARHRYLSPYNIAVLYLGLGDRDEAITWLQKAVDDHSEWIALLNVDPRLKPLRGDAQFKELQKRLKLGPAGDG